MNASALLLLPLLLLVAAALARPAEPDGAPAPAALEELVAPQPAPEDAQQLADLARARRSPQDKPKDERGSVTGGVHREKGVGTVVHAQGEGTVWQSKKGNTRVDAHGEWSKVVNGPGRGKPNYNVGVRFTHRF